MHYFSVIAMPYPKIGARFGSYDPECGSHGDTDTALTSQPPYLRGVRGQLGHLERVLAPFVGGSKTGCVLGGGFGWFLTPVFEQNPLCPNFGGLVGSQNAEKLRR